MSGTARIYEPRRESGVDWFNAAVWFCVGVICLAFWLWVGSLVGLGDLPEIL